MTIENEKWGVSFLFSDLYEKRGEAYLSNGDYLDGIRDYQRIFAGMPQYGKFIHRWHVLGNFGRNEKFYLDVKGSDVSLRDPRLWVKEASPKRSEVIDFDLGCTSDQVRTISSVTYDSAGIAVEQSSMPSDWSAIVPDSLGEELWDGVCQKKP